MKINVSKAKRQTCYGWLVLQKYVFYRVQTEFLRYTKWLVESFTCLGKEKM